MGVCSCLVMTMFLGLRERNIRMLLHDPTLVQCLLVFGGVAVVFGEGLGKVVIARKVLLGAEIEIMVLFGVEYGLDCRNGRDANRAGR